MASRRARSAAGGLLTGLGEGLLLRSEREREDRIRGEGEAREDRIRGEQNAREDVLIERENAFQRAAAIREELMRRETGEIQHEQSRGLLQSTDVDDKGNIIGITRGGEVINTGTRAHPSQLRSSGSSGDDDTGLSPGDQRLIDTATERHTTSGGLSGDKVDWQAVADTLATQGRADLARIVAPSERESAAMDVGSPEYTRAQEMADEWISGQSGIFSRDSSDFADFGGNRETARAAKIEEYYRQLTGRGAPVSTGAGASAAPAASGAVPRTPSGAGTQQNPFRAIEQADVDWFRDNAPEGSVIEIDGELWTK